MNVSSVKVNDISFVKVVGFIINEKLIMSEKFQHLIIFSIRHGRTIHNFQWDFTAKLHRVTFIWGLWLEGVE